MSAEYLRIYADFLRGALDPLRPQRVVFDFSNGPTALVVPLVVRGVQGITPTFIDGELSGNFPAHGPNPLVLPAVLHLHREVLAHHADLGVIFDADGDRAFFVDHRGRWIPPYAIAHLLSLHEEPPYLFEPRTYFSLEKAGLLDRERSEIVPVGTYFIKRRMRETGAGFAGEYSGHYFFKEFFSADSGILAAVKVINAVTRLPYTLADFYDLFPRRVVGQELNIESGEPNAVVAALTRHFRHEAKYVHHLDKVTLDFGAWFLNIRPSNTEPLIRLFIGSTSRVLLERKSAEVGRFLASELKRGSMALPMKPPQSV